jgi:hypothetical protein
MRRNLSAVERVLVKNSVRRVVMDLLVYSIFEGCLFYLAYL